MGLFGKCLINEFEDREPGYYFQVLLTKPRENKIPVNPTRMWETEKEALKDLPFLIPKLVERDTKDYDTLVIRDASILGKYIYIAKIEKPHNMDIKLSKIEDIEKETLQRYLQKNNIMFKVKIQNSITNANRNKVINLSILNLKDSLKNTETTRKCVKYIFKENTTLYDRFIGGYEDSLEIANYNAYLAIPNPRRNVKELEKFYSELHDAVNSANADILRMGYKLELIGEWDRGFILLEYLASSIGEASIIYEDPTNLKIDGVPAEDDNEDDEEDTAISNEPEDTAATEEPPAEEEGTEDNEPQNEETPEEDLDDEEEEDDAPANDDRITDTEDEPEANEGENVETQSGDEPVEGDDAPEDSEGEDEDDAPADEYKINTDDQDPEPNEGGEEPPAEEGDENEDTLTDYRTDTNGGEDNGEESTGNSEEDVPEGEGDSGEENEIRNQEDELFANLSPEQRRIQDEELKDNYINLFNTVGDLINRVDQINLNNEIREPVSFVRSQLNDLKDFIFKYLSEVYSTKTYIENNINYQQYLVILNNINQLLLKLDIKSSDID